jgi:hypothetical protein
MQQVVREFRKHVHGKFPDIAETGGDGCPGWNDFINAWEANRI